MCTLCRIVIIVSYYPIKQLLDFCCCKNLHKVGWTKEIAILNGISNFHRGLLRSVLNRRREEEYRRGVFVSRFVFCYNFRTKHLPGSRRFALIFICKTHRQGLYSELRDTSCESTLHLHMYASFVRPGIFKPTKHASGLSDLYILRYKIYDSLTAPCS